MIIDNGRRRTAATLLCSTSLLIAGGCAARSSRGVAGRPSPPVSSSAGSLQPRSPVQLAGFAQEAAGDAQHAAGDVQRAAGDVQDSQGDAQDSRGDAPADTERAAEEVDVRPDASPSDGPTAEGLADSETNRALGPQLSAAQVLQLPVEACVQTALQSHPRILAARARAAAARNRVPQERALPDPMVDNMFWPIEQNALQTAGGRMQDQLSLTQDVPWPEKLRARAAIAAREAQVARAEAESVEREVAEAVRLAYYELWAAQRTMEVVEESRDLVSQLISVSESRYRVGGSQQDVIDAQIERERLQQQLLEAASQRAAAQAELAALMQQPRTLVVIPEDSLPLENLPTQLDALVAAAEQCNPDLQGRGWEIQRDLQRQRLAALQRYPDLRLGTQYGFMTREGAISRTADGLDNLSFSVGMTLPIWRQKIDAGISEAAFNRVSSSNLYQDQRLSIEGQLRRLLAEIDSLDQQRSLYAERIIPRSEQAYTIATSDYTVGRASFYEMVETYRELLLYKLQIVRLDAAVAARVAQLERTVGCEAPSAYACSPGAPIGN